MKDMETKIRVAMDRQCQSRGFCTPADVLIDIGTLDRKKYEDWLFGRAPFLEAVCNANLHKLTEILKQIRICAAEKGLKPSLTDYRQRGSKSRRLRFTKTGNPQLEKAYATYYVRPVGIKQVKLHETDASVKSDKPEG